jgi:hypothetical protein
MTLVDDAERLTTLAEQADAAADAGSIEAALSEVLDRLIVARRTVGYAIVEPRWWQYVPEPERRAVHGAAERAAAAAGRLPTESDQVLAAYGRGDTTMDRGALGALLRVFREYGTALRQAQDEVLRAWSEQLWSLDQRPELEVHALVPETAAAAREILAVTKGMADAINDVRMLDGEALGQLFDPCEAAGASAATLRELPVPSSVLDFFTRMAEHRLMPLGDVAAEVFAWLDDHDATRLFVVSRLDQ